MNGVRKHDGEIRKNRKLFLERRNMLGIVT